MTKRGFLLISHGFYAKEFAASLQMIAGKQDDLFTCCLETTDGPESFTEKLRMLEEEHLKDYEEVLVFADLMGGSPGNTAYQYFAENPKVHMIAGMNFPMVLTALLTPDITVPELIQAGKDGIVNVRDMFRAVSDEDMDD